MTSRKSFFRILSIVILLTMFVIPVNFVTAGSLQTFAESPIPYWYDDSVNVVLDWDSDRQVVIFSNDTELGTWYDVDFPYRKMVNITGSVGAGTGYQVLITVIYDSNMQADFDDLVFTDNDKITLLDFWIESYIVSTRALVWVKINDDLGSNQYIYMYYGNAGASSLSNGEDTFLFFDDFNDGSLDSVNWHEWGGSDGVPSETGGSQQLAGQASKWAFWGTYERWSDDIALGMSIKVDSEAHYWIIGLDERTYDNSYATGIDQACIVYDTSAKYYSVTQDGSNSKNARTTVYTSYRVCEIQWTSDIEFYEAHLLVSTVAKDPVNVMGITLLSLNARTTYMNWTYIRNCIDTEPSVSSTGDEEEPSYDYIGDLDVSVPVMRASSIQLEFLINKTSLEDSVRFELYDNSSASGFYCIISDNAIIFPDSSSYDVSSRDLFRVKYTLMDERRIYKIRVYSLDDVLLKTYIDYFGRANNNLLRIFCSSFSSSFELGYLSGDVNYLEVVNVPSWEIGGEYSSSGCTFVQGQLSNWGQTGDTDAWSIESDIIYSLSMDEFGYFRTEWLWIPPNPATHFPDGVGSTDGYRQNLTLTVYYDSGEPQYIVYFAVRAQGDLGDSTAYADWVITYYDDEGTPVNVIDYTATSLSGGGAEPLDIFQGKCIVWRTQENHLGVMAWDSYGGWSPFGDNVTMWVSEDYVESFDATLEFGYLTIGADGSAPYEDVEFYCSFERMEYCYYMPEGIPEPHFSSTFFEYGRGVRGGGSNYVNPDAYNNEPVRDVEIIDPNACPNIFLNPFGWIAWQIINFFTGLIGGVVLALQAIGTWVVEAVLPVVGDVISTIVDLALSTLISIINSIGDILFSEPALGTMIVAFLVSVVSLASSIFYFGAWFVGTFSFIIIQLVDIIDSITFILSTYMTPLFWPIIVLILAYSFVKAVRTRDFWAFFDVVALFIVLFKGIFSIFYNMLTFVVSVVVNLIPFT